MTAPLSKLKEIFDSACKAAKASADALTVLSSNNDPYRQSTPAGHREGSWIAAQLARGISDLRRIHLRGLHYLIVARGDVLKPDGKPYINNDGCWNWLNGAVNAARWLGYTEFDRIIDNRNAPPILIERSAFEQPSPDLRVEFDPSVPTLDDIGVTVEAHGFDGRQKYALAFYGEKSSLADELAPLARRYAADLYLASGEISVTLLHTMARRGAEDGRPLVVFTLADFDPAGNQMAVSIARKLQALRDKDFPSFTFLVVPVGLNVDQVRDLDLPSTPLKETELRADRWREEFGHEQTEIDALAALRPGALREMVIEAVRPFFDETLASRVSYQRYLWRESAQAAIDERIGSQVEALRSRVAPTLAALKAEFDDINAALRDAASDVDDLPPMLIPEPELPLEEIGRQAVLFSSEWEWAEGTRALKARKTYGGQP